MAKRRLSKAYPNSPFNPEVVAALIERDDKDGLRKYEEYLKEHKRELARLEREAKGIVVPGDYDRGGY